MANPKMAEVSKPLLVTRDCPKMRNRPEKRGPYHRAEIVFFLENSCLQDTESARIGAKRDAKVKIEDKDLEAAKKTYISSKSAAMKSKPYPSSPTDEAQSSVVSDFLAGYGTISTSAPGFLGSWSSEQRLSVIRGGLPYSFVELLAVQANIPVREVLEWLQLPQTTYNKRKRDNEPMSRRDTELLLEIADTLFFGLDAFNNEADKSYAGSKAQSSLGGITPLSCFDAITGVKMVRNALARLAYGNLA